MKNAYTPRSSTTCAALSSTSAGIAGMQPKILVPDRPAVPVPSLIAESNDHLWLKTARRAGIGTAIFELSDADQMLAMDAKSDWASRTSPLSLARG